MKSSQKLLLLVTLFLSFGLFGCSWFGLDTDPTYQDKEKADLYKNGSIASDNGGIDLFGPDEVKPDENSGAGIGVNGFLWRASLDTISFMPIASADPFGGVIITDWYSAPDKPDERIRLNVFIRDRELRADGIKVSVFRQTKDTKGNWVDAPVIAATSTSLENTILTRARQIRLAQKQFK
jgi:hypothetical protein